MISVWHFSAVKVELCVTHSPFLYLHPAATLGFLMKSPWPLSFGREKVKLPPESRNIVNIFRDVPRPIISISLKYHSNFFVGFRVILRTGYKQTNTVCPPPLAEGIIPPTAVLREALYATPLPLPKWARLQLKAAVTMPYLGQPNVSIFFQWIQGWFVWILLINCSHVNYWCSSVRPAFWMTDGWCSQVILHLHPTPHASVAELQKDFQFCVSHPLNFPLLPIAPPVLASSSNCLWHFCNIHVYMLSSRDFALTFSLYILLRPFLSLISSQAFAIFLTFLQLIFSSQPCQNTHLFLCSFDSAIFFSCVYVIIE